MRQVRLKSPKGPIWVNENCRGAIRIDDSMLETDSDRINSPQYPEYYTWIDSDTIEIDGVKYTKMKPKLQMTDEQLDLLRRAVQSEIDYEIDTKESDFPYPNKYSDELWNALKESFKND